ncbi:MAG: hypothetical protein IKL03_03030 [Bacteroidaceae bacterium]|nr:hypothetical protein [Bacteroidaceae bacterium]
MNFDFPILIQNIQHPRIGVHLVCYTAHNIGNFQTLLMTDDIVENFSKQQE